MSLNNPNVTRTLNISGRTDDLMIDKLTFEPLMKSLYWINRSNSTNSTIERFDILSGTLAIIAADAAPVSGIYTFATTLHHHCIPGHVLAIMSSDICFNPLQPWLQRLSAADHMCSGIIRGIKPSTATTGRAGTTVSTSIGLLRVQ